MAFKGEQYLVVVDAGLAQLVNRQRKGYGQCYSSTFAMLIISGAKNHCGRSMLT